MIVDEKNSNIYITITTTDKAKSMANFKIRLLWDWCKRIGLNEKEKQVCISYEDGKLIIKKAYEKYFTSLTKHEKVLQVKKYEMLYGYKNDVKKELIQSMEEYFNVSYRTIYRLLKEEVSIEEVENVKLMKKQEFNENRNINLMTSEYKGSKVNVLTIPTHLAVQFLTGKTYEELNIKNAVDLYPNNVNAPISMRLVEDEIIIGEYDEDIDKNKENILKEDKDTSSFKKLSTYEKTLQVKKYESLYKDEYKNKTALINAMKEYFDIKSTPTVYKYLREDVDSKELDGINLIKKENGL